MYRLAVIGLCAHSAFNPVAADECPGEPDLSAPAGTTFFEATGWCDSDLNGNVGLACTPAECWDLCVDAYGADKIVAVDLSYAGGGCYCQNSCDCMDGSGSYQVIARDTLEELPDACGTQCSCEWQYDGACDVDLGYCDCDPHDCSSLGSIFGCEACVDAGGVFCAKDALCAAPGEAPSLETVQTFVKTATCDAADYSTDCPAHPLPDPAYDAVAWYLGAINVEEVWASGITGAGVTVLISDDGVDASHPDLAKLSVADSCDHYLNAAATDSHGTHCAALAVGSSNDHCGVGVAHGASLASCKTLGEGDTDDDVTAFAKGDVNSNSWGIDSCFVPTSYSFDYDRRLEDACPFSSEVYDTPCADAACADADFSRGGTLGEACKEVVVAYCSDSLKFETDRDACLDLDRYYVVCSHNQIAEDGQDAIKAGVTDGRGGKGIVYVFSSGNEYTASGNANFEGYLNSRYVMTVGAVGMDLLHSSYSSTGASVFVSAPGGDGGDVRGMVTANPVATGTSCGDGGVGTSYATPIVSGVAALMLEANPNLGWRDVQGIIATTSKMPDDDGDLPRSVNAAGIGHSYQYGFGIIDAAAAVAAARTWQNYGKEAVLTAMASPGAAIADDGAAVTSTISAAADADFEVETVVVLLTIDHPHRGDLRIVLERGGVESLLAPDSREDGDGYADWKYMTVRHWGESANGGGAWKLKVEDVRAGNGPGTFVSWTLQVHGHSSGCSGLAKQTCKQTDGCAYKKKTCSAFSCSELSKKKCKKTDGCDYKKRQCSAASSCSGLSKKECKKTDGCKYKKKKGKKKAKCKDK